MLDNPQDYIEPFARAGAQQITIHAEPDYPVAATLCAHTCAGLKCGLAFKPGHAHVGGRAVSGPSGQCPGNDGAAGLRRAEVSTPTVLGNNRATLPAGAPNGN